MKFMMDLYEEAAFICNVQEGGKNVGLGILRMTEAALSASWTTNTETVEELDFVVQGAPAKEEDRAHFG